MSYLRRWPQADLVFRVCEKGCCAPIGDQLCVPGSVQVTGELKEKGHHDPELCHEPPVAGGGQDALTLNGQRDSIRAPPPLEEPNHPILTHVTPQGTIAWPPTALIGRTRRPSHSCLGQLPRVVRNISAGSATPADHSKVGWGGRSRRRLRSPQQRVGLVRSTRVPSLRQSGRHCALIAPVRAGVGQGSEHPGMVQ